MEEEMEWKVRGKVKVKGNKGMIGLREVRGNTPK